MQLVLRKPKREVKCITDDITFESINACARYYQIEANYLRAKIIQKEKVGGKQFIFLDNKEDKIRKKVYKVSCANLYYQDIKLKEWCELNNIDFRRVVSRRMSTGESVEEVLDYIKKIDAEREKNKCWNCKKRCCDGCPFLKIEESVEGLRKAKGGFKEEWEKDI